MHAEQRELLQDSLAQLQDLSQWESDIPDVFAHSTDSHNRKKVRKAWFTSVINIVGTLRAQMGEAFLGEGVEKEIDVIIDHFNVLRKHTTTEVIARMDVVVATTIAAIERALAQWPNPDPPL